VNPDTPAPSDSSNSDIVATTFSASLAFLVLGLVPAAIFPTVGGGSSASFVRRSVDGSNLRSIGGAWLAVDTEAKDQGRPVENSGDVHALAAYLARQGLNDPKFWISPIDQAQGAHVSGLTTIVRLDDKQQLDPKFKATPLAIAIALFPPGIRVSELPPHTPIAWTRGLQPDGSWSKDSPYSEWGGHIFFAGENLERFRTIDNKLIGWTGRPTSDIRQTLPPGTRISESMPTAADLRRGWWAEAFRKLPGILGKALPLLFTFVAGFMYACAPKKSADRSIFGLGGVVCAFGFWMTLLR
jgi:hypothetical protein